MRRKPQPNRNQRQMAAEQGSALVLAIFVLALLSIMGLTLLTTTQLEVRMSRATVHSTAAFYLAEAAVEAGRQQLFTNNGDGPFDDDLVGFAGADGVIDFDPATVVPVYDAQGQLTGLSGFDDDVALLALTQLGEGWYATFVTNDPDEGGGIGDTSDTNDRVMITGVGAAGNRSFEVAQAIVEPRLVFPTEVPATITIFGPNPFFDDVDDATKLFTGDDCNGAGIPGFKVPVVGLLSDSSESVVESSLSANTQYTMGSQSGDWTVVNLSDSSDPGVVDSSLGAIDPAWNSCAGLTEMAEEVRAAADVVCTDGSACALPPSSPDRVIFVDDDFQLSSADSGAGMLWVTGTLSMNGQVNWNGLIVVVGDGVFERLGVGTGVLSGATVVANIAGPDAQYGTADDCTGGTDGFATATYDETVGGTGVTTYCFSEIEAAVPYTSYAVVEFRQR